MLPKPVTILLLAIALLAALAGARDKGEAWVQVQSPHFMVISNGSEKQARRVADQFERIRSVFQAVFSGARVDTGDPIIVLAARDDKAFQALQPSSWSQKGHVKPWGFFLRSPEKNYVILRLDVQGDHPYHVVYHEYTHLLIHQAAGSLPTWLDEGLAEFYGNSEIEGKEVGLGRPSGEHLRILLQNKLLPLSTLFAVDQSSPYYNEDNKISIFYAESWALTHYLMMAQNKEGKRPLTNFLTLLDQGTDVNTAAVRAFGNLGELQKTLEAYIRQTSYGYVRWKGSTDVDEEAFKSRALPQADSAAIRGDILIHTERYSDARGLLAEALQQDPNHASALASMGFLEFRQGHQAEAKKWFEQAVKVDAKSYLAHYYYAVMTMQGSPDPEASAQVESSLRNTIRINPNFAPAYNALASFYTMKGEHLEEARLLVLHAVALDPVNVGYFVAAGNIMLRMNRPADAVRIAERALGVAKSAEDRAAAQAFLDNARKYQEYLAAQKKAEEQERQRMIEEERQNQLAEREPAARHETPRAQDPAPPVLRHRDRAVRGKRDLVEGVIKQVKCSSPAMMDLIVDSSGHALELHADNYFEVEYRAANFTPTGELLPCTQLRGMKARIIFSTATIKGRPGEIISVELTK